MSYEKIKSIKVNENEGKLVINGASNNVRPLLYSEWECHTLSETLKEKGRKAAEIEILKAYESGEFQQGQNKYTKALKVLYYVFGEEYKKFDWRNHNAPYDSEERKQQKSLRKSEEFNQLLRKALDYKFPKEKFIVSRQYDGYDYNGVVYGRKTPNYMKWSKFKDTATKFDFREIAESTIKNFSGSGDWEILEVLQ